MTLKGGIKALKLSIPVDGFFSSPQNKIKNTSKEERCVWHFDWILAKKHNGLVTKRSLFNSHK